MSNEGDGAIRRIVVVGGGTAGWLAAAPLAQAFVVPGGRPCELVVVESPDTDVLGVGDASLSAIRCYNQMLGLDGVDFVTKAQAAFTLGIEFKDWRRTGHRMVHDYGDSQAPSDFALAFHFEPSLYAACLREQAVRRGAERIHGTVVDVELRPEDGFVAAVKLGDGRRVDGDLFIDCSGSRARLIGDAMGSAYEDWSTWLPCNSMLAVPSARVDPVAPYITSTARAAGWQWRIPLPHRTRNGHVYCDHFMAHDEAARVLLEGLDAPPLDAPRRLSFTAGRRRAAWVRNVVALGSSAGFLEPLASTSTQLIMDGVRWLMRLSPDRRCQPALAAEFNRLMAQKVEAIRDFVILHYKRTERTDNEFWRYCAAMPTPDTLAHQLALYRDGSPEPSCGAYIERFTNADTLAGTHHPMSA